MLATRRSLVPRFSPICCWCAAAPVDEYEHAATLKGSADEFRETVEDIIAPPSVELSSEQTSSPRSRARQSARPPQGQDTLAGKDRPEARSSESRPMVGSNLRRMRTTRGLSLERLARASGVSRAMLCQIELGQSTPTINTIWKIARALNCQFSALITSRPPREAKVLRAANAQILTSRDGTFSSRALFPFDESRLVEFYELRLAPLSSECAEAHSPNTVENLVVTAGSLEMVVADMHYRLVAGDAIQFEADVRHEYRNAGSAETVIYPSNDVHRKNPAWVVASGV